MKRGALKYCLTALLAASACHTPPEPPEIQEAEVQSLDLRRAGVPAYFPLEYQEYDHMTREAKEQLFKTRARFSWFRNYEETTAAYQLLLARGEALLKKVSFFRENEIHSGRDQLQSLHRRMASIKRIALLIREGRSACAFLTRADLLSVQAESLIGKGKYDQAGELISQAWIYVNDSSNILMSLLDRYNDPALLTAWNQAASDTIRSSRERGSSAIVVSKLEQVLTLYRKGLPVHTYTISLGQDGLFDKKHAGDYATPEGRYRISRKNQVSRYNKALLIDYPNPDDAKAFSLNQKKGLVPSGVGIGGTIEIHGGGNDVVTDGCVSMTDREIDQLYPIVEVGTPVTIIGSRKSLNSMLERENE